MVAAAVLWSLIGPFSKNCMAEGLQPLEIAFWRGLLGCMCFFGELVVRGRPVLTKDAGYFGLFGILGVGLFYSSLQISIQRSGAAMAMILMYTAPIWVAVFSRIIFHERVSGCKIACIAVALVGAVLVCLSGGSLPGEPSVWGIFCGIAAGFCYAVHFPFYVWWSGRHGTAVIYAWMLLGGTMFLYPLVDFAPERSWAAWGNLLALGIVTNYMAYFASGRSLERVNQVQAAVIGNIEPVLATFWVWLLWGENFSIYGWVGSGLILAAVLLLTMDRKAV